MNYDPVLIDQCYRQFRKGLSSFLPEGTIEVDIDFLEKMNLLKVNTFNETKALTRCFQAMEFPDKITLINDQFIIWIVPEVSPSSSSTLVLIALNHEGVPQVELAYQTKDIYNSSKLILQILEKLLQEIQDNEESLKPYLKAQDQSK